MLKIIRIITFLIIAHPIFGQFQLSENSKIYLITFGPSQDELYTAFGHSAIRVSDPNRRYDVVFNYGAFNFEQENFYLNFALGKPYYALAIGDYQRTKTFYSLNNQSIIEQELNLSLEQRQALFEFLDWNLKPENRSYLYDYFYDNCSTRIPDAFFKVWGSNLYLDTASYNQEPHSFREMVDVYTPMQFWGDLGIDICLGLEIDQPMKQKDYLFLPDYLYRAVDKGTITMGDSVMPLVKSQINTYVEIPTVPEKSFLTPKTVFWILFLVIFCITFWEILKRKHLKLVDIILLGSVWIMGIFLLILWFGTAHKSAWNFNLLWANPFHGLFLFFLIKNIKPQLIIYHFLGYGSLLLLTLVFWTWLPQQLHPGLVPVVIALALRSFWIYRVTSSSRS